MLPAEDHGAPRDLLRAAGGDVLARAERDPVGRDGRHRVRHRDAALMELSEETQRQEVRVSLGKLLQSG